MNFLKVASILRHQSRITERTCRRNFRHMPEYKHLFKNFHSTYPDIRKYLTNQMKDEWEPELYGQMLDFMLRGGRQIRPAIVLKVHEAMTFASGADAESEGLQRIHVLGWIVETVQAAILMMDDYDDESQLRRGEVPWYVGRGKNIAMDLIKMTLTPYYLLNGWFGKDPFYHSAAILLQRTVVDEVAIAPKVSHCIYDLFKQGELSWKSYRDYCVIKSRYTTELSFKLAAFESTKSDLQFDERVDLILDDLSYLCQLQNDGLSILPKPEHFITSKDADEDIKFGNVDFALVFLMNNADEKDKNIIKANFGKGTQQCVDTVRELYDKYDVANELINHIENLDKSTGERIDLISNEQRLQDGLIATRNAIKMYMKSDPGVKYDYINI